MCASSSPIEFVPYEQIYGRSFEDLRRRVPNLSKILRVVGYRPLLDLDHLLESVIRDTREQMGRASPVRHTTV
jgi:UDP-glucose 4-epimerase